MSRKRPPPDTEAMELAEGVRAPSISNAFPYDTRDDLHITPCTDPEKHVHIRCLFRALELLRRCPTTHEVSIWRGTTKLVYRPKVTPNPEDIEPAKRTMPPRKSKGFIMGGWTEAL